MLQPEGPNSTETVREISRVSVKIPPFWPEKPALWFCQLEGQFALCGVTSDSTKFYYVIAQLDNKIAQEVEDVITAPPVDNKYERIKGELIKRLSTSQEQRTRQLLEHEEIGDRTPSQFLRHLRNLAGTTVPDNFLQTLWLNRLPSSMQAILATQSGVELNKVAELADKINETSATGHVAQVSTNREFEQLSSEIRELKLQIAELTQQRGRSHNRYRRKSRTRSNTRNHEGESTGMAKCWYHFRFGEKAKKCTPPCDYSGNGSNHH